MQTPGGCWSSAQRGGKRWCSGLCTPCLHPPVPHAPRLLPLPSQLPKTSVSSQPHPPTTSKMHSDFSRGSLDKRCCRKTSSNEDVHVPLCQQRTWSITWSHRKSPTPTLAATSQSSRALTTSRTQSWRSGTRRTWRLCMRRCRTFTVRRKRAWSNVLGDIGPFAAAALFQDDGVRGGDVPLDPSGLTPPGRPLDRSCWLPPTKWKSCVLSLPAAKTMLLSAYTSDSFERHCLSGMACMLVLW